MPFTYEIDSDDVKETEVKKKRHFEDIKEKDLLITPSIKDFLDLDKDTKFFIISPKGFGKTLFLKYKRIKYEKKYRSDKGKNYSIYFIPGDRLIDDKRLTLNINWKHENFLNNEEIWHDAWLLSIILSVIKNIDQESKIRQNEDYILISDDIREANLQLVVRLLKFNGITPFDYLDEILRFGFNNGFYPLKNELNSLLSIIRGKRIPTAIFLEEIDITFINEDKTLNKQTFQNISKLSQIALMSAVRDLSNINQHIKVFACICSESYMQMRQTDEFSLQMRSNILSLNYSKNELKMIFIMNIKNLDEEKLTYPKLRDKNPIYSFLGLEELSSNNIKMDEDIFDYIYRHTLKRPIDLIVMIEALANLSSKTQENIKEVINEKASKIALAYIKDTLPYLTISFEDLDHIFGLINKNILNFNEMQAICSKFNNKNFDIGKNCINNSKTPIFVELYNIGFLGIVGNDYANNGNNYQNFLQPGELFGNLLTKNLPQSPTYFIHPTLYRVIKKHNPEFEVNKEFVVGDGYPFNLHTPLPSKKTI